MLGGSVGDKTLTIKQAQNGFIATIENYGETVYKEPYAKGTYIFTSLEDLTNFMDNFFSGSK